MAARNTIAIEFSRRRLRAVQVVRSGDLLRVRRVVMADVPQGVDPDDPTALGAWIGELLEKSRVPRGRATFAIARDLVSLKRMTLPTIDVYELPDMVRLSMQRDLPFDPNDAVIDFVPVLQDAGQSTVLVAAIRRQTVEYVQAVAKAAALQVERLSLRCMGLAALIRTLNETTDDDQTAWLGIDITTDGVELIVLTNGSVRFSRAADVAHADDPGQFAEAVLTETRRSWMSYRVVEDAPDISGAFVMGDPAVTRFAHESIGDLMNVKTDVMRDHPRVSASGQELASTWPLTGLLLEPLLGTPSFDFARPRRAPDRHAKVRQWALAGAGAVVVGAAALAMFAAKHLTELEGRAEGLLARIETEAPAHYDYERDLWRTRHLERWEEARVNWLEHLMQLGGRIPAPNDLVLDGWSGTLRFSGVRYDDRERDPAKRWSVPREVVITIDGEARTQATIDAFREAFVETPEYQARAAGPDTQGGQRYPFPFKLTLRTSVADPAEGTEEGETGEAASNGKETESGQGGGGA